MAKHCRFVLLLLSFVTLVSTKFSVTRKDDADYFTWEGNEIECDRLTNSTAFGRTPSLCTCLNGRTFSTESRTCESFQDHVFYRFDRDDIGGTSVSAVHAVCDKDHICSFNSSKYEVELAVTKVDNQVLNANSNCIVNFVEMIRDCIPRQVDLKLNFTSHSDKIYLQLNRTINQTTTIPLRHLNGELFLLDITCANDDPNQKMMFKYSGTKRLDIPGPFDIPPYDPSKSCSEVTTSTSTSSASTHTISPTSTRKVTRTTSTSSVSAHTVSPTSTGIPNHIHRSTNSNTDIEMSVVLAIIVAIVIVSAVAYNRLRSCNFRVVFGLQPRRPRASSSL